MAATKKQSFYAFSVLNGVFSYCHSPGLQMTIKFPLVNVISRHSNLNFAHHFIIYWLLQNGALEKESTPGATPERNHTW